jgi:hypothetical protein
MKTNIKIRNLQEQMMDIKVVRSQAMNIKNHMIMINMEIHIMIHIKKDMLIKILQGKIIMVIQHIIKY